MAKDKDTTQQEAVVQQPQAPQPRPCPQDCRQCNSAQQLFCTTKMLFDMSRTQQALGQQVEELKKDIADIKAQIQPKEQNGELSIPFSE